jgi:hypothetical protein
MNSVTDRMVNEKWENFFKKNIHKIFVWFLIFLFISSGISTYVEGECINCIELTTEEVEMLFDGELGNSRLMEFLENREFTSITTVPTFLKLWFVKFTPSAILFSLFYFAIVFMGMLINKSWIKYRDKQRNIYKNKLKQK